MTQLHSEYYVFTELSVKKLRFGGNSKDKQISFMEQKRLQATEEVVKIKHEN